MSARDLTIARLHARCSEYLAEIAALFPPGMKLTLVVRNPSRPDGSGNIIVSNDEIDPLITALEISKGHRQMSAEEASAVRAGRPFSVVRADEEAARRAALSLHVDRADEIDRLGGAQ